MKYIIANWKANKNLEEARKWLELFSQNYQAKENVVVVIAPPLPFLQEISNWAKKSKNVAVACQDLSHIEEGSYTGEVTAKNLQGLVEYAIVGHSERRIGFGETDETVAKKIELAHKYQIKTILCIRGEIDKIVENTEIIAYEPVEAIGTGNNASPDDILRLKSKLKISSNTTFLYGGSVTDQNVSQYLRSDQIDGLLIGGASLDAERLSRVISQV